MKGDDDNSEISRTDDLLKLLEAIGRGQSRHAHKRFWFRGQSDSTWHLHPAVYRGGFPARLEKDRLSTEQHLMQDFRVESAGLRQGAHSDIDLY
jgi:hypothetical protein